MFFPGSRIVEISQFPFVTKQEALMEGHSEPGRGWVRGAGMWVGIRHPSQTLTDLGLFKDSSCRG